MLHRQSYQRTKPIGAPFAQDEFVCWTKMQAEAGQSLDAIIARKERERAAGRGLFMWGVGNAPAVLTNILARLGHPVPVVFSRMKSRPKAVDVAPTATFVWRSYVDRHGLQRELPANVVVTSRGANGGGARKRHYALMCHSDRPLMFQEGAPFDPDAHRNASGAGGAIGASQVTSLLRQVSSGSSRSDYSVNLSAHLVESYWVRLADPVLMSGKDMEFLSAFDSDSPEDWLQLAERLREGQVPRPGADRQYLLI